MDQSQQSRTFTPLVLLVLTGLWVGIAYGQAPSPQNPPAKPASPAVASSSPSPDRVVLKVGDEQVTQADVDFIVANLNPQTQRSLATQGRRSLGEQFAMVVLLSQQAVRQHLESSPVYLRQLAMQRRQLLAQAAYQELVKQATVSPEETSQYFWTHQSELDEALIREVVIRKRQEAGKPDAGGLAPADAQTRAEAIRKALAAGTDVKKVAEQYQIPNDALLDVEPRAIRRGAMRPEMEKAAFELKDGEVSEIFDVSQALVLFQVAGHRHPELKDASAQIENTLRQQKVEAALAELKRKTPVWMDEQYFAAPSSSPPAATVPPPASTPPAKP